MNKAKSVKKEIEKTKQNLIDKAKRKGIMNYNC